MSDTMIERISRALCTADGHNPDGASFSSCGDPYWQFYTAKAKAVLAAMREPTEAMVVAGRDSDNFSCEYLVGDPPEVRGWSAMIDAAIAETRHA